MQSMIRRMTHLSGCHRGGYPTLATAIVRRSHGVRSYSEGRRLVTVFVSRCSKRSTYVPLTHTGIGHRYELRLGRHGSINEATSNLASGRPTILHLQWEDAIFGTCSSETEADDALNIFRRDLARYLALGGRAMVTIHNGWPHRHGYRSQFVQARQLAVDASRLVLVHNAASVEFLAQQVTLDRGKLRFFAHPSYLGTYEPLAATVASLTPEYDRTVLCFGEVRRQKGFDRAIGMLPVAFLASHNARLKISGQGRDADALRSAFAQRSDVIWDIRHVPDEEAPPLIRSAACVILPYEHFLTSGVAHLVVSSAGVLVAPAVSQHRDLLPHVNHRFLYRPGDDGDFRRAVAEALELPPADRLTAMRANCARAVELKPEIAGQRLAAIYGELLA